MTVARRHICVQVANVGFVDAAVGEAAIVGAFVDDHGVLHVVSGVADDGYDCISATGAQIEVIVEVLSRANQWSLWEKQAVDLVVHSIRVRVIRCAHRLLSHLALVHVSWALIVVAEWNSAGDDGKHIETVELLVSRVWSNVFLECRYGQGNLLKWADPLNCTNYEVLNRSDKSGNLRRKEYAWEVIILLFD